jgi:hypothetical protein
MSRGTVICGLGGLHEVDAVRLSSIPRIVSDGGPRSAETGALTITALPLLDPTCILGDRRTVSIG